MEKYRTGIGPLSTGERGEGLERGEKGKIVWRLAKFDIATDWTHALCERSQNAEGKSVYYSVNSVGINRISLKTPKSAKEFSEIIKKLEVK